MSAEPALPPGVLLDSLRRAYGLDLNRAAFLAGGTAPAYRVEGPGGRFFVKVLPDTPSGRAAAVRIRAERSLLRVLRASAVLTRIPQPLPTLAGAELAGAGGFTLAPYRWIDAVDLWSGWTAALPQLAPLLGRLHAGTARIMARVEALPTPPEDFAPLFAQTLLADLGELRTPGRTACPGLHELRGLLGPHGPHVRRLLARAEQFRAAALAQAHELVVCHTDAHGGNVMRDAAGELWLIDWETARLAPREHDLWMLRARLPEVLPLYEAAAGHTVTLDPDLLGFYLYRRVLEDLAVDVAAVLRENTRPTEDAENLRIIRDHVLPASFEVEAEFGQLTAALVPGA